MQYSNREGDWREVEKELSGSRLALRIAFLGRCCRLRCAIDLHRGRLPQLGRWRKLAGRRIHLRQRWSAAGHRIGRAHNLLRLHLG